MALLVMLPAALGLPLSALHLGRPFLAMTAMKNIKTSWLSREALALGVFTGLMSFVVALYFFEVNAIVRLGVELITLTIGIYGIYAQAMIYRIKARPSWNRVTTNLKFFGVSYVGAFLLALLATILGYETIALPLVSLGMMGALAQMFFTYEDIRSLSNRGENEYQLSRTLRLYDENFLKVKQFRFVSIFVAGLFLPLIVNVLLSSSMFTGAAFVLSTAFILMLASELSDRFLFYSTVVPLGMAGGFFVGKQR
jgi:DMSO reductase anchor subunit